MVINQLFNHIKNVSKTEALMAADRLKGVYIRGLKRGDGFG